MPPSPFSPRLGYAALLALAVAMLAPGTRATTAVAWSEGGGTFGLAANGPGDEVAAAAVQDCRRRGGGGDCRVVSWLDQPGYGALYESCAGRQCKASVVGGRPSRDQAHQDARQACRDAHGSADCMPLADWEEFGIAFPAPSSPPSLRPPERSRGDVDFRRILQAAGRRDADAEYVLGKLAHYTDRHGEAFFWLNRAAEDGSQDARTALAIMHLYGRGTARNPEAAARLLADPAAADFLEPDGLLREKYTLLEESAFLGQPGAQAALGTYYHEGRNGIRKDSQRARFWLDKAAGSGDPMAQYHLGMDLFYGAAGQPQDRDRGFELLKRSANQGFALAQTFMGVILESRNRREHALAYFRKAARQGEPIALRKLKEAGLD